MKKLIASGIAFLIVGCGSTNITSTRHNNLTESHSHAQCHTRDAGKLPDPNCTPGAVNPDVSQANIQKTICVSGYTAKIRPSSSYTNRLKIQQIAAYGYVDNSLHDYEEDHLISLELGGAPSDRKNLWPESPPSPNPKDKVENFLHREICKGNITLKKAQTEIATDWTKISVP